MKKHLFLSSFTMAIICLTTSCATIIHGSKQDISISSNPSSAIVTIDDQKMGETPLTTRLTRKANHTVTIELPGYMPYETNFTRKVDAWIAGNIVFGGLIGLAIDAITGGMYKLTPDQIQAELRNQTASIQDLKSGIFLTVVLKPNPDWKKIDQLERIKN